MSPRIKLGRYRLVRRIGVGGMAEVYEAEVGATGGFSKRLAIKVLLPQFHRDREVVKSFIDEANIAASLSHPNIVPIYDFGQIDGTFFLVMEYQDGWDLRQLLERCGRLGRPLPVPAVAFIGHELAMALDHIHQSERGIVHRDVSPHNVFVSRGGDVKLGDFGIAKAEARLAQTEQGQIKGKLAYLAPEQVSGDPVTCRTDVYAAGLLLFEMLTTSRYNAAARDMDLLQGALNPRWRPPSSQRPDAAPLDEVVEGALQKHPAMRTRDAALFGEQLAGFLERCPFDGRALAALVDTLATADGDERSSDMPIESFGVGRRATEPPIQRGRASGTMQLPEQSLRSGEQRRTRRRWLVLGLGSGVALVGAAVAVALAVSAGPSRVGDTDGAAPAIDSRAHAVAAIDSRARTASHDGHEARIQPDAGSGVEDAASPSAIGDSGREPKTPGRPRGVRGKRRRRPKPPLRPRRARREPALTSGRRADAGAGAGAAAGAAASSLASRMRAWREQISAAVARARERGLFAGDQTAYDRLVRDARAATDRGAGAEAAIGRLRAHVDRFQIDQSFIRRKLGRLERAIAGAKVPEQERRRLSVASQKILRLVLADRLVSASRQISRMLAQLR